MGHGMLRAILAALLLEVTAPISSAAEPVRYEFESKHMGTSFRIVMHHADKAKAVTAAEAAFARVAVLERVLSDYRADSEVMTLCKRNDADPGKPMPISSDLAKMMRVALDQSRLTDGAFDVTVGPLTKLWRISRKTQEPTPKPELTIALGLVGFDKIRLDENAKTLALADAGMRLDFGGIGKGFAVDEALIVLKEKHGIENVLMAAAGDVTCRGTPPGKPGWLVEIAPLRKGEPTRSLLLKDRSVSTSGDLEQVAVIGGVRYSHVLNPKTGIGLTGRRSVTVIGRGGAITDALTKAACVLPPERVAALFRKLLDRDYLSVLQEDDAKPLSIIHTPGFTKYLSATVEE